MDVAWLPKQKGGERPWIQHARTGCKSGRARLFNKGCPGKSKTQKKERAALPWPLINLTRVFAAGGDSRFPACCWLGRSTSSRKWKAPPVHRAVRALRVSAIPPSRHLPWGQLIPSIFSRLDYRETALGVLQGDDRPSANGVIGSFGTRVPNSGKLNVKRALLILLDIDTMAADAGFD
jgi:hypothetical protein